MVIQALFCGRSYMPAAVNGLRGHGSSSQLQQSDRDIGLVGPPQGLWQ